MVGNLSNFTKIDLLRCLLRIEKPASRLYISKALDLGEGTVRSILDVLKKKGLLASNNQGHSLNEKGKVIVKKIRETLDIIEVGQIKIFPGKKSIAAHIKNPEKIEKAFLLRDEAVKNGAEGALILKYDKKLEFYDSNYKEDLSSIESKFNKTDLNKDDIVIVAYADSYKLAEHGALAAAISLDYSLIKVMSLLK